MDRFKISINFLETVKLFIAKSNICLGSFFVHMMTQIPNIQRWILLFVFYICDHPHLVEFSIFSPTVAVLLYHRRNSELCTMQFWTIYFLLVKKSIVNFSFRIVNSTLWMEQPIKVSLQTCLENFGENFARKCFQLNSTLSLYRFVHFNRFSCFKICKICDTLLPLKQNLLLNPPIFLTLLISGYLFQLFLISNMIMMNFF